MKQRFFDLNILKLNWKYFSIFSTIVGFILAILGTPKEFNWILLGGTIILFFVSYSGIYVYYKYFCKDLKLKIGKVKVRIKFGDIFKESGIKAIPLNEYFDTQVDDVVIAHNSLHGMFVDKYISNDSLESLNNKIDTALEDYSYNENPQRKKGKNKRYEIGTSIIIDDFLLTALTRFNERDEAYLSMQEYLMFLNVFWNQVNRLHNGRIINVPIMGSGLSRINPTLTNQEYLEQIIWALKTSTLITSKASINIIVYDGDKDTISLSRLKTVFNDIVTKKD